MYKVFNIIAGKSMITGIGFNIAVSRFEPFQKQRRIVLNRNDIIFFFINHSDRYLMFDQRIEIINRIPFRNEGKIFSKHTGFPAKFPVKGGFRPSFEIAKQISEVVGL